MKEKEFINIIKDTLNSKFIGDDCAYLKDLGIVISQDSLIEDVHFLRKDFSPYQLGFKSVMVNISDICASGADPKYLTMALSLPDDIDSEFVRGFYEGAQNAAAGAEIVGGDITGADKIYISATAIGSTRGRRISSRSNAKVGQYIIVSGEHGSSAAGLRELMEGKCSARGYFINAHKMPKAKVEFSKYIAENIKENYAMMDTSDGLMDALSAIAEASGICMEVDFNKIPYADDLKNFKDWKDLILFGGEDYQLVATVPEEFCPMEYGFVIGRVKEGHGVNVNSKGTSTLYTREDIEKKLFNHFKE